MAEDTKDTEVQEEVVEKEAGEKKKRATEGSEEVKETEAKAEEAAEKEKPLDKMTATELREIAKDIPGVTGVHAMKKDQLLEIVKEARGIKDEGPVKKKKGKAAKEIDIKALKEKIARLKAEKTEARNQKDKNKVNALRRRINRLKKRTRKAAQA